MPRKTPKETIELIQSLHKEKLPLPEIAKKVKVPYTTVLTYTRIIERGFSSPIKYRNYLAEKNGDKSFYERQKDLADERGDESKREYEKRLAEKNGKKLYEHEKYLAKLRRQRPENQKMSSLIIQGLRETKKTARELAREVGVTGQAIQEHKKGNVLPKENLQEKIFQALNMPYKTLDDVLQ